MHTSSAKYIAYSKGALNLCSVKVVASPFAGIISQSVPNIQDIYVPNHRIQYIPNTAEIDKNRQCAAAMSMPKAETNN
jgi:hypothetical protein